MTTFKIKPAHATDSYKLGHRKMYPKGTQTVYSNLTPRTGRLFQNIVPSQYFDGKMVAFGLQGLVKHMHFLWQEEFFDKPKDEVCSEYARRITPFVGPNGPDVSAMEQLHDLGYLPLIIKGVPEGSVVPFGVPVFTVRNTHEDFFWLTNYLETYLSNEYWKVATSATIARIYRKILTKYADLTGSPQEFIDWQGHDFSCRGMSGMMDAAITGSGHLTSFCGTDTLVAVDYVEYAYHGKDTFVGGSVPASEHSVMTMGGPEGEYELFERLISKEYPSGIVSLVSDSYDFWRVITEYAQKLKPLILARTPDELGFAKVVFRPDSGDPVEIIAGLRVYELTGDDYEDKDELPFADVALSNGKYYTFELEYDLFDNFCSGYKLLEEVPECVVKGAVECLWDTFGGTTTATGHKLLDSHVGLIYGDSITLQRADEIMSRLAAKGFASANVVLGIGSYTYNYNTRDTLGMAVKATYGVVEGEGREIFKAPKTDSGLKHSAKGLLRVNRTANGFELVQSVSAVDENLGALLPYYSNGELCTSFTLDFVRQSLRNS